jgi:hypothetical protein
MNRLLARSLPVVALLLVRGATAADPVPLVTDRVPPVRTEARNDGKAPVLFADFGKDAYGTLEIVLPGEPPAGSLTVRLGEKLDSSGAIDRKPPGSVSFREVALVTKPGERTYRLQIPRKPRHNDRRAIGVRPDVGEIAPFRYAEIAGEGIDPAKTALTQLAVHAPFDEGLSAFSSSDSKLDAVWDLCKHTMKASSAFGVFIDGERERIPYEADAYITQLSFAACDPDPRLIRATFERLMAYPTWPTEWLLHMPMIAWSDYMATGDPAIAAKQFDVLKKRFLALKTTPDGLLVAGAIVDWPQRERDGYNGGVADPGRGQQVGPVVNTVANAFYCHALDRMGRLASALGRKEDAADFDARAKRAAESFNRVFLDPKTGLYTDGEGSTHSSLHANMFPLAFGLVPKDRIAGVADFVKSRGMACSVYGAQYLLEALMAAGLDADAVSLMTSHGPRSWHHMMDAGSTMTWEAWDPSVKPNLTWNHAWGAAPANIISRYVLGIRPMEPGYAKILIAPQPGGLAWVRGKVPTVRGPVEEKVTNGEVFRVEVSLPEGTSGEAVLPRRGRGELVLDGKTVGSPSGVGKTVRVAIAGGKHVLESR